MSLELNYKLSDFKLLGKLGSGGFSEVHKASRDDKLYALKFVMKNFSLDEVEIHSSLNHPNIVKCYGYFMDTHEDKLIHIIILEYVRTNYEFIKFRTHPLLRKRFIEIGEAISYLHGLNIIHKDIKPQNIIISAEDNRAMLLDFGCAMRVDGKITTCGTIRFIPPEFFQAIVHHRKEDAKYVRSLSYDVWSFGILILKMGYKINEELTDYKQGPDKILKDLEVFDIEMYIISNLEHETPYNEEYLKILKHVLCPIEHRYTIEEIIKELKELR